MKAMGMFSGGLDSQLAVRVMKDQGITVMAVYFYHRFNRIGEQGTWPDMDHAPPQVACMSELAREAEVDFVAVDFSQKFLDITNSPKHGRGKGFNPCLDCRIAMLTSARDIMEEVGAAFVFTGEVLGQRPMSQHKQGLQMVAKRSGLEGLLLRPLSARLLPPTLPEDKGWVDRSRLLSLQGRNRTPQFDLAKELGVKHYPTPAGGCFLTDPNLATRFFSWTTHHGEIGPREMVLLRIGRHFHLPGGVHVVVGREKSENEQLRSMLPNVFHLATTDSPGASVFLLQSPTRDDVELAARLAARYSKARTEDTAHVSMTGPGTSAMIVAHPADDDLLAKLRVGGR